MTLLEVTCPTCEDTWHVRTRTTDNVRDICRDCNTPLTTQPIEEIA